MSGLLIDSLNVCPQNALTGCRLRRATSFLLGLALMFVTNIANAQMDRVYPLKGSPISGNVSEIKKDGVIVESGQKKQAVAVDQIEKIMFGEDPKDLTKGRESALDGQWDQALDELKRVDLNAIKRDIVKVDAAFFIAKCEAKVALAGRGSTAESAKKMLAFVTANPESIHFYGAARLLGDLAVAMGNFDKAVQFYGALSKAPSADLKIEAAYLTGLAKLRQGKSAEAEADFDKVIGAAVQSTSVLRIQTLSKAGRAVALSQQGKGDEGIKIVDLLITELNQADSEMAARIYNAQGSCFEATGDTLGAAMAYLHTHLMFSGQADAHAEALSKLVQLWPKLGKPERANEAREELQKRYPGWGK